MMSSGMIHRAINQIFILGDRINNLKANSECLLMQFYLSRVTICLTNFVYRIYMTTNKICKPGNRVRTRNYRTYWC